MTEEGKPRFLSLEWRDIEELTLRLAEKIRDSGFEPDVIIGVLRGGWLPAKLLSDYLGIEALDSIEVKFYRGVGETRERPVITRPPLADLRDKKVLVVDDVSDTGKSLSVAVSALTLFGPEIVKTATLYVKPWTLFVPDYYVESTEAWIAFPWEKGELLEELASYASKVKADPMDLARLELGLPAELVLRIARIRGIKGYAPRGED